MRQFVDNDDDSDASSSGKSIDVSLSTTHAAPSTLFTDDDDGDNVNEDDDAEEAPFAATQLPLDAPPPAASRPFFLLKLPNFLVVQRRAFDVATYEEARDTFNAVPLAESSIDESRDFKAFNVIRSDATASASNACIVRWSNGTQSLKVGAEFFDMTGGDAASTEKTLVFARHAAALLASIGRPAARFQVRPSTTSSAAHKRFTHAVRSKHCKERRIKIAYTCADPALQKAAIERAEQEKLRLQRRLDTKRRNAARADFERTRLTRAFLEDDRSADDEDDDESAENDAFYREAGESAENDDIYSNDRDRLITDAKTLADEVTPSASSSDDDDEDVLLSSRFKARAR